MFKDFLASVTTPNGVIIYQIVGLELVVISYAYNYILMRIISLLRNKLKRRKLLILVTFITILLCTIVI